MPNYLPPYWTISVFISICHSLFLSFHSQHTDSCKGSYHGVDLQSVTPPIIPLSLSTFLLVPLSPPTPPHRLLSFSLLFFLSDPVICLRSSADNNVFYLWATCTKGPPNWSNASRLMSPQQSAFPNPTGPEGGRTRRQRHSVHGKHNSSGLPDPRSH